MNVDSKQDLKNRLNAYSELSDMVQKQNQIRNLGIPLAAGALASLVSQANASVKVTDINPDVVLNTWGAQHPIDLDGGGTYDVLVARVPLSGGFIGGYVTWGTGPAMFMASYVRTGTAPSSYTYYPLPLNGSSAVLTTMAGTWTSGGILTAQTGTGTDGLWGNKSHKYLGVAFQISGNIHYGWVEMSVSPGVITIHKYAYEQTPDTGIPDIDASLSVDFSQLIAVQENNNIKLSWLTESEIDNLGFVLERKSDNADWIEIASYLTDDALKGAGNTSSKSDYAFIDDDVLPGETYSYRLSDVSVDGLREVKDVISITLDEMPIMTDLLPASPNPFNPTTKIQYTLAKTSDVSLKVVDMTGRTVQNILTGENQTAGSYSMHWNGETDLGQKASSGIYLLVLQADKILKTQKVMLIR